MLKRTLIVACAGSCLLFAAVVAMWVRSHWVSDRVQVWRAGERWDAFVYRGTLVVQG